MLPNVFENQRQMKESAEILRNHGVPVFEDDVSVKDRYLMERFIRAELEFESVNENWQEKAGIKIYNGKARASKERVNPRLKALSFDIEWGVASNELYSISYSMNKKGKVYMLDRSRKAPVEEDYVVYCPDEKILLENFNISLIGVIVLFIMNN